MSEVTLLRLPDVIGDRKRGIVGRIPMSATTWYRGVQKGRYPKPVRLSEKSIAWVSTDIDKLIREMCSDGYVGRFNQSKQTRR
jgi:prophage regulatory protein